MIKKTLSLLTYLFTFILIFGCGSPQNSNTKGFFADDGKIKVLCTIEMINDLVRKIGQDKVVTATLIKGELDPHSYQLVKGDDEKISFADIIFYSGLGLEHGPSLRDYLKKSKKSVALGDLIQASNPSLIFEDRGSIDPHIWMDISLWAKSIPFIVKTLSEKDPENSGFYRKNGEILQQKMLKKHEELIKEIHEVPAKKRYLVTSHDAFNYFTRAYLREANETKREDWQMRFAAPEGLAPESQLSANDIRLILHHIKKYDIHVIFPESNVSRASIRKLVDAGSELGLQIAIAKDPLYGDAMGRPGSDGDTHLKMIEHNVKTIKKYLLKENAR